MGHIRINWTIAVGILLIGIAVIYSVSAWSHDNPLVNRDIVADTDNKTVKRGSARLAPIDRSLGFGKREAKPPVAPAMINPIHQRLEEFRAAGNLIAIHDELQTLADAHQLPKVRELLADWCGKGTIELAQWSLALSRDSDPDLNLALYVEALSNPAEIVREMAAAEVENRSGIRFKDSAQARSWLASRRAR